MSFTAKSVELHGFGGLESTIITIWEGTNHQIWFYAKLSGASCFKLHTYVYPLFHVQQFLEVCYETIVIFQWKF